jgi:methyl-accepting chemotaxis protein
VLTTIMFLGALTAMVNTLLIVRQDFTGPIADLESRATEIAAGELDVPVERVDQRDEIGRLTDSFAEMQSSLRTVSAQAEALAEQNFDDDALDEEIPGAFGDSLSRADGCSQTYSSGIITPAPAAKPTTSSR